MRVLIVGAGPVGMSCAHLLGLAGIESVLIEKQVKLSTHPSAHFIHSRTMEILRDLGLSQSVYANMPNTDYWRRFIYCSHILGDVYRAHDHFKSDSYKLNSQLSDMGPAHFPQHKLLHILADSLPSTASLQLGKEFLELSQGSGGVTVKTLHGEKYEGDYVIACDGAASKVRNFLNIKLVGSGVLQSFLNVHFISKELGALAKGNPGMIYFVYNPEIVSVVVMHNADEGEFIMQLPFYPNVQHPSDYSESQLKGFINISAGSDLKLKDINIKSIKQWRMTSSQANVFSKGRVFLAGDSAHQMTPAGGFGLNTGIKDAHNLCWKFSYPELLDYYTQERHPFVQDILKTTLGYYLKVVDIAKAFGLNLRFAKLYESAAEKLPFGNEWFTSGLKMGQRLLFDTSNARSYLSHDKHLLDLVHPKEDLELSYVSGYFENGGALAPNIEVEYNNTKIPLRALPAQLMKANKRPTFIKLQGKNQLPSIPYETFALPSHNETSYLIRPDGHIYSVK